MSFTAAAAAPPALDGDGSDAQWAQAPRYPLPYNQLSKDQSAPFTGTNPGTFRLIAAGNALYGLVQIAESEVARYDAAEVVVALDGAVSVLVTERGKDFARGAVRPARAVWSRDGRTLEFMVQASDARVSGRHARFSLGLLGAKDAAGVRRVALFPFCGYSRLQAAGEGKDLGAEMARKAVDTADLLLQ